MQAILEPIFTSLLISLAIQLFFFVFAASFKSDKVTDLSYGLSFVILAWYLLITKNQYQPLAVLVTSLITLWGLRLAGYLFIRILKIKKDKRFDGIRENPLKFAAFWFFQGVSIFIIMLPSIVLLNIDRTMPINSVAIVGTLLWLIGFIIETVADYQKFTFKNKAENKGKFITTGIWKYARFPNYFGEMLMWWSIFLITIPVLQGWQWLSIIGALHISFILLFITGIPTQVERHQKKYGDKEEYQEYVEKTSLLIPLPPKD
jgi:steroid 5-alpha reductase family enzyme